MSAGRGAKNNYEASIARARVLQKKLYPDVSDATESSAQAGMRNMREADARTLLATSMAAEAPASSSSLHLNADGSKRRMSAAERKRNKKQARVSSTAGASAAFGGGESKGGGEGGGGDTQIDVREGWYFLVDLVKMMYEYAYPPYAADLRVDLSVEYREGVFSSLLRILSNNNPREHGNGLYDACRQHAHKATHSLLQRCLGASRSHSCAKVRCNDTLWRPLMQALHRALQKPDWESAWRILYGKMTGDFEISSEMKRRRMFASTADEDLLSVAQLLKCSSAWSTAAAAKSGGGGWQEGPGTLVDDYLNGLSASVLARELIDTRSSSVIYLLLYGSESLDLDEEEGLEEKEQQLSERGESILREILLEDIGICCYRLQAIVMADTGNRLSYLLDDYTRLLQLTPTNAKHQKAITVAVQQALYEGDWAWALRAMFDTSGELNKWGAAILKRPEWTLLYLSQTAQNVEGGSDLEAVKILLHGIVQTNNVDMNCTDATNAVGEALENGNILVVEAFIMAGANLKDDKEMWSTKSKYAKFHLEWKHRIKEAKEKRKKAKKARVKARVKAREKRQKTKIEEEQAAKNTNGTAEGVDVGSTKKGARSGAADNDLKQSAAAQALHVKGPGSPKGGPPPDPTVDLMDQIHALLRQVKEERHDRDVEEAAEAAEVAKTATAKTDKDETRDGGSGEGKSDEPGKGRLVQPKSDDAIDRDIAWMEAGDEGDDANAIKKCGSKKRARAAQQQEQEGGRMKGVAEESQVGPRYLHNDLRFDDLTWDVFFTDNVLKLLQKKMKREVGLCQAILNSIERLASGEWRIGNQNMAKKVIGCTNELYLMECRVNDTVRILWEKATMFSPRRSGQDGTIWADCIRLWAVTIDHDNLTREIEAVKKSQSEGTHAGSRRPSTHSS